jgi:hypothetical protein
MQHEDIETLTIKQMVDEYNALTGENIKRFASRSDGNRRLMKARISAAYVDSKYAISARRSWRDPEVRAKRQRRNNVIVNGTFYRSVRAAFISLDLPVARATKFRLHLNRTESGEMTYHHEGKDYKFKNIPEERPKGLKVVEEPSEES